MKRRLLEVYPQWDAVLRQTKFIDSLEVDPADNDGQNIYYNSRRFAFYLPEAQAVLLARQVLHVQLAHFARRGRRNPALWRRATEAVVNALLAHDGFQLPEDSERMPPETEPVAETVYAVLAALHPPEEQDSEEEKQESDPRTSRQGKPRRLDDDQKKIAGNRTDSRVRQPGDAGTAEVIPGLSEYLQDSANVAYELTFLIMGVLCAIYVLGVKKQRLLPRQEAPKYTGAIFETIGQFFYIGHISQVIGTCDIHRIGKFFYKVFRI